MIFQYIKPVVLGVGVFPHLFLELVMHHIQIWAVELIHYPPLDALARVSAAGLGYRCPDHICMNKM